MQFSSIASELAGRGPLWIKYILVNNRLYDYTAYVRRISNYTSYVRRIIRYLKNKCTVQCMGASINDVTLY